MQAALESKITVRDGDSLKTTTALEAVVHSLMFKAIKGDTRSTQTVLKQIANHEEKVAKNQSPAPAARTQRRTSGAARTERGRLGRDIRRGPVDHKELKATINRMYEKSQVIMGVKPPNTEDSGE